MRRVFRRHPRRQGTRHRPARISRPMNPTPPTTLPAPEPGCRIHALTGAATGTSRELSAPLSAEITAAFAASPKGEIAVRAIDVDIPLLEKNDILAERNRGYFLGRGLAALTLLSS